MKNNLDTFVTWFLLFFIGFMLYNMIAFMTQFDYYVTIIDRRGEHALKDRIIKEGNILKYPFRTKAREAAQAGDCDSPVESGQEPEEKKET